ncbi:PREDICTED: CWF19-like protein 2 [Dufourea novaeangliae]|uniref:CWF19-like protein 2 n=1 Tax=Dufourea novaeangliae TaxID=178035 RepID=UPI000766F9B5|nr:PREDICTED: CWF19-like protein 2 [Dufourea novaeangliae]
MTLLCTLTGSESEQEWVEKSIPRSAFTNQSIPTVSTEKAEFCKREDWMNVKNIFPCVFNDKKSSVDLDKHTDKSNLDKLGQSDKELNLYWKNGGNGLPSMDRTRTDRNRTMDVNWLKKSLKRAQEQAENEGRSLEEIAAERWGSLEVIQSMIFKAEKVSMKKRLEENAKQCSGYAMKPKRNYHRSRSRSCDRREQHVMWDDMHYEKQFKQAYKKPMDDNCSVSTSYKIHHSTTKRWQKGKISDKTEENRLNASDLKTIGVPCSSSADKIVNKEMKTFTEEELNKLGAKIVKAEIMGNTELAAELKIQLKKARELVANTMQSNESDELHNVILARTDNKGITRPLESRGQSIEWAGNSKQKNATTHVAGKRVLHYFDDDKYSLQQLFQREKGRPTNEDDAQFVKVASRNMNMDEIFEEQIIRVQSDAKQDEKDRSRAIKEHKQLSKSLGSCHWCIESKYMLKHMIVAMDSDICLSLPACTSLTDGHCIITPVQHVTCQLQLDEDIWEKLKAFKQTLHKMFVDQNKYPVFYESYKSRHKFLHMQLECVPLPKEIGELVPMYFKKALLECETEWSMNKKVIDLEHKDIRHAIPNGLSYFVVEFETNKGYAHVIEDEHMFPKSFAEEIIGGMLDLDHDVWRKRKRENFDQQREKVLKFLDIWKKYDSPTTICT